MRRRPRFLLVDDNAFDVRLLRSYFDRSAIAPEVTVIGDGQLAVDYVRAAGTGDARVPDLVILDLNLPKRSGFEVLTEMKEIERLCRTPVVVLSTSRSEEDARLARRLDALYLRKPSRLDGYEEVVGDIQRHWAARGAHGW